MCSEADWTTEWPVGGARRLVLREVGSDSQQSGLKDTGEIMQDLVSEGKEIRFYLNVLGSDLSFKQK